MMTQMAQMQSLESSTNMQKAIDTLSSSFQSSLTAQQNSVQAMTNATAGCRSSEKTCGSSKPTSRIRGRRARKTRYK